MNLDSFIELMRKGLRVSLGATASLLEVVQDPQKRDQNLEQFKQACSELPSMLQDTQKREENLRKLQDELTQLSDTWATKGEITERDARNIVDTLLAQYNNQMGNPSTGTTINTTATTVASTSFQREIQDLTTQVSAIREELEKMRQERGNNHA
jgi:polyhydroxyalkanoate synthesis regulator phasin